MNRPMSDAEQIAAGCFYTDAELRAHPHLRRAGRVATVRRDPNDAPPSEQARRDAASNGVCDYCREPGDDRSTLELQADHYYRHPECQAALDAEGEGR